MIGGVELMEMKGAAMSELYKEMKRIEDYQSTKPLYKQIAEIKGIASTARYGYDIQPQLTIPESIADEFDQIYEDMEEYQTNVAQMFSSMQHYFVLESYPEILHWLEDDVKNTNVVLAYLAGKALGVDLVKVVEG